MPVTIRSRLLLLVLSVLLPGLLGVGWLISRAFEAERVAHARTLHDTARALSLVIDREIEQRATVARVLSQSRALDAGAAMTPAEKALFHGLALTALNGLDGWLELRTADAVLLDTRLPIGTVPAAAAVDAASAAARRVLFEQPEIQPLQGADDPANAHAAIIHPVQRQGRTVLNLVITLRPQELQRIIDVLVLPENWIGTVLDTRARVVARHPGGLQFLGRAATRDLQAQLQQRSQGLFESVSLDGKRTTAYFNTSQQGWVYVGAMPREQFAGLVPQTLLPVVVGALLLLVLAVGGALWVAGRIVRPVQALKAAAAQMQAGQTVAEQATGIVECDEVAVALSAASRAMLHARSDLERQVAEAVAQTRQAEQRISQSQRVEALGRLTGGVAHDFNNLLGVISNSAHLLGRHPAAAELQMPLAAVLRAVEVGSRLTQHLLRFAGRRPVRPQSLELGRYLPEIQELMRSVLGRQVQVIVRVAPDTAPVHVDSGELELALVNLALNARDAMPSGGELRVTARNADADDTEGLPGAPQRRYVMISVGDEGSGIAPEVAAQVFEPFFTTKPVGKGTGLGLSQVHGFCVQAGGTARVASTPGLGTTVSMLLPAADGSDAGLSAALPGSGAVVTPEIAGTRLLLVEDNAELGDVTAALLKSHGAVVERADSAATALHRLEAEPAFDIVLSDVVMPGEMDGLAMARQLAREQPSLPLVLISGFSIAAGVSEFKVLRKPCSEQDLLAALHQALIARAPLRRAPPM